MAPMREGQVKDGVHALMVRSSPALSNLPSAHQCTAFTLCVWPPCFNSKRSSGSKVAASQSFTDLSRLAVAQIRASGLKAIP